MKRIDIALPPGASVSMPGWPNSQLCVQTGDVMALRYGLAEVVVSLLAARSGAPLVQVTSSPGVVPTGVVIGNVLLDGQKVTIARGTAQVCLADQSQTNQSVCDEFHGSYRLAQLPGVYAVTAAVLPTLPSAQVRPTDPASFPKPLPCSPMKSIVRIEVGSTTQIDFTCQGT